MPDGQGKDIMTLQLRWASHNENAELKLVLWLTTNVTQALFNAYANDKHLSTKNGFRTKYQLTNINISFDLIQFLIFKY